MSRSGYTDDREDNWRFIMYRGAVASATKGERGQTLLRELLQALDEMPARQLVANEFEAAGAYCTLGVIGARRGVDIKTFDTESGEYDERIGPAFNVADALVREIMYLNDECVSDFNWEDVDLCGPMRPGWPDYGRHQRRMKVAIPNAEERRWNYMRSWVASQIKPAPDVAEAKPAK